MRHGVFYSPAAQREIIKLARRRERRRILDAIDKLVSDPRPPGPRKLTNRPLWRIRVGDHRVIYSIGDDGSVAVVLRVAHRTRVYEVDLADHQRRAGEAIRRTLPGEGHRSTQSGIAQMS